jgi:hypothetical protein
MPKMPLGRPNDEEFAPYYGQYVSLVPTDDLISYMTDQISAVQATLAPVSEERADTSYAPGKWTIKEVVGHLSDTERVFQYRAMSIARCDPTPLPGFDQAHWTPHGGFNDQTLRTLLAEWTMVRRAHIAFVKALPDAAGTRMGQAADNPVSVRALSYIPVGHVAHHLRLFRERYFA